MKHAPSERDNRNNSTLMKTRLDTMRIMLRTKLTIHASWMPKTSLESEVDTTDFSLSFSQTDTPVCSAVAL
jgi:hypothetical protein